MQEKMQRFLTSIGLSDVERFDLSFEMVTRDKANSNKVMMSVRKETPWEESLLEEFKNALGSINYEYVLRFAYNQEPTVEETISLFDGWYLSLFHGIAPITLYPAEDGQIGASFSSDRSEKDQKGILNDFQGFLDFLTYPFMVEVGAKERVAPKTIAKEEKPKEEAKVEKVETKEEPVVEAKPVEEAPVEPNEAISEEEAKRIADQENAEKEYLKDLRNIRYSYSFKTANDYMPVKSLEEVYSLDPINVEIVGTVFEASVKLSRKGTLMGNYGLGDAKSAVTVKAFEGKKGLPPTAEEMSLIKIGDVLKIKGTIDFDKFTGERIISARAIEHLPSLPLRGDPEPLKRVELHLHSKMSAMDGCGEMSQYCAIAKSMGMKALAVTDHADIQAFPAAQNAAKKNGLKMIYGCEFYMFDPLQKYIYNPSNILLSKARYCVLDTETTGLSAMFDRMTEFGGVIVENGVVVDRLDTFINPEMKIPPLIAEKTHITDEMVKDAPKNNEAIKKISDFIGDAVLVTHNASFDFGFLNEARKRAGMDPFKNPVIDTLTLSHYIFPDKHYHNLEAFSKNLGIQNYAEDKAHRADADAESLWNAWNIALSILDPKKNKTHADLANLTFDEDSFPHCSTEEIDAKRNSFYKNLRVSHVIALVKNAQGLKDMYKLISLSNTQYLLGVPRVPKSELEHNRENLIIGSACFNGEVYEASTYRSFEELKETMRFYDYIEIQPKENYSYLINMGETTDERLDSCLKMIVEGARAIGKPVCATGDVHYPDPEDKICRDVYVMAKAIGGGAHPLNPPRRAKVPLFKNPDQHFRSTREMLDSFMKWLPEDQVREMVITNTNKIADEIEDVYPVKPDIFPPNANLPDSASMLKEICYGNLEKRYGENCDPLVKERLDKELEGIIGHGYSVTYYIAHCIIKKSNEDGYIVGSRGSVGSSFAATMADITEVNPLAPHYLCPKCKHFEWNKDPKILSGFDLPEKKCPVCGETMVRDGQNIPFETFLGFSAEKVPDIDLNFPPDYQARAHDYTRQLLGEKNCFRAGTIETVAEKNAFGFVRGYYEKIGINPDDVPKAQIAKIATKCQGVKRTTGQHPGGIVVIPKDMDVFDFTPYQHPADDLSSDWLTTHYEFASMHDEVLKLDLLGHVDPLALRKLSLLSKRDIRKIPMDDRKVLSLFNSPKALGMKSNPLNFKTGAIALPEFGTNFVQGLLNEAKPHTFNDLLIISGLSHGTDVWNNNAEDLINSKTATLDQVIGCRDDIMNYLISMGVPNGTAFSIMEEVRHNKAGKPLKPATIKAMEDANVPSWYIESCKKIKYLFPRAHATAYVMGAVRQAYFKLYLPLYFYAVYFSVRCDKFDVKTMVEGEDAVLKTIKEYQSRMQSRDNPLSDKELEIMKSLIAATEMLDRGFKFKNIDLYKSDASDFVVDEEDKALIPPFSVLEGLGAAAAVTVVEARKKGKFISKEDLHERTKLSETNIKDLASQGALDDLGETNQMSLFEF